MGSSSATSGDSESSSRSAPEAASKPSLPPGVERLIEEHHESAFRYAYRLCGNQADAEDITQQAFMLAMQRLNQLREIEKARGWVLTIVRTCFLKSLNRRLFTSSSDDDLPEPTMSDPLPEWVDRQSLEQCLAELPEESRVVLLMYYFEERTYQEIAVELNVPLGTVMSRLSRAKTKLRTDLAERGGFELPASRTSVE